MKRLFSSYLRSVVLILGLLELLGSCQGREQTLQDYLADPKAGDVYVVSYEPAGSNKPSYFYYQLIRFTADSAHFHPARREVPTADVDLKKEADLFDQSSTKSFSRQELREFTQAQQGDAYKILLTTVRRE